MNPRDRGLVESEEQDENKNMKLIVVEEQEQEEGSESETESETGFVDLDRDALYHVLMRVDMFTLGRAACVNKLWRKAARDNRLWQLIFTLHNVVKRGEQESETGFENLNKKMDLNKKRDLNKKMEDRFCIFLMHIYSFKLPPKRAARVNKPNFPQVAKPPPLDFYSIDPQVFSSQIGPWV